MAKIVENLQAKSGGVQEWCDGTAADFAPRAFASLERLGLDLDRKRTRKDRSQGRRQLIRDSPSY